MEIINTILYPPNGVQESTMKWATYSVWVWMCVVNIVNPAVDWPLLLHTLADRD